jgi:ribonuclease HI
MKPYKATKNGAIPNSVLRHAREHLVPHLAPLFRATNTLKYYPQEWSTTETLVMKKPGKPDYTIPTAWRPIVLSDGLARLLNSCQTNDIVTMCERHNIIPANHFGARPGRTTTDSIHLLTKTVKDAWRKGLVASALFLDVKGAFPSVDIDRLIHNMRKRGIPEEYTSWMRRRLRNRITTLSFDEHQTENFTVTNGLDQGDPFSGICYLIYNADLLKIPNIKAGEQGLLFVDDATIIATGKDFTETHEKLRNMMNRPKGVFEWAKTHNCEFGVEKFQLLDLTRKTIPHPLNPKKRTPTPRRALVLGRQRVPSAETAKFLGVIVDNKLNWKAQCAAALAKGHAWLIQFARITRASKGATAKYVRKLYLSIAIPRMLYAADIFLTPQRKMNTRSTDGKSSQGIINKLASVQRQAAIMITGAMRTTATDILDVMANLLPFHLLVDKLRHRAALRLATLPASHPLHKPVANAAGRLIKRHPTPLHDLMHTFSIKPQLIETIDAVRHDTQWKPDVKISIAETAEGAAHDIHHDNAAVKIYTDGSGMEGKIGAAAILYRGGRMKAAIRHQLGAQRHHTVYEGESVGMILAIKLMTKEWAIRSATICVDNQATIRATQLTTPHPGHYLTDIFHRDLKALKRKHNGIHITVRWTPGHKGIEGNERADELAKKAITEGSSDMDQLPRPLRKPLPRSKSAATQAHNEKLKRVAQKAWTKSPRYEHMKDFEPTAPSKKYLTLVTPLPRKAASILTQLRTGHAPLAKHLHRIGKADSPICPTCRQNDESVQHYILHCTTHHQARQKLRHDTGGRDIKIKELLSRPKTMRALFQFVATTQRFQNVYGDIPALREEREQRRR